MTSDLIDIELWLHHETAAAVLVSTDSERKNAVWLPKSAIEIERRNGGTVLVTMPERLAVEKELV